ncbi:RND family efflux transporter MFP subunit [Calothrix parasitica NIES-267]|uniref:RND family efflux transporter MFP subunit n=1 Tax=Calothrix parasitica NIES-267 TaxID=1973488 RepID=A0A1Z4LN47_9CYAN|nr:RND family efflux transporter MFP subunit [Calothrix parasitica NIES-267]
MKLQSSQNAIFQPVGKGFIKHKLSKWLIGLLILCSLTGGGYIIYRQMVISFAQTARSKMLTVPVERETLPIIILANGTIEAKQSTNVSPDTSGRLKSLLVKEGDYVKVGQILARMDDSTLQGQLIQAQGSLASAQASLQKAIAGNRSQDIAQAQAQLEQAQANLQKAQAGNRPQDIAQAQARLKSAQASLTKAEDDFKRNQQLYNAGAISLQILNQQRSERDSAQASVNEAREALALQKAGTRTEDIEQLKAAVKEKQQALALQKAGTRTEDIEAARAQVTQQQGNLKTIQTQIENTVIRAPFSGIVTAKYADPGGFVTPTTSGSEVSSATSSSILSLASNYQVVAKVAETDISKIKVGQSVTVIADAYSDKTFKGKVAEIAPQATVTSNVTSFEVKVDFTDPETLLRPNMNVNAKFDAGKLSNVLVIPTVAILRQKSGTGVRVITEKGTKFVPIKTGLTINGKTEVRSGLQGNEKVLLSAPSGSQRNRNRPPGGGPPPL